MLYQIQCNAQRFVGMCNYYNLTSSLLCFQILIRLSKLCVQEGSTGKKSKKQQQRLLRNMGAHSVVLELLQIPYEKVQNTNKSGHFKGLRAFG